MTAVSSKLIFIKLYHMPNTSGIYTYTNTDTHLHTTVLQCTQIVCVNISQVYHVEVTSSSEDYMRQRQYMSGILTWEAKASQQMHTVWLPKCLEFIFCFLPTFKNQVVTHWILDFCHIPWNHDIWKPCSLQ